MLSNLFMIVAGQGNLKQMAGKPWPVAARVSWGIALFEHPLGAVHFICRP